MVVEMGDGGNDGQKWMNIECDFETEMRRFHETGCMLRVRIEKKVFACAVWLVDGHLEKQSVPSREYT